jgi:hypothetical protein
MLCATVREILCARRGRGARPVGAGHSGTSRVAVPARAPSCHARSGSSRPSPAPLGPGSRRNCSSGCWRWPAQSASTARRWTPSPRIRVGLRRASRGSCSCALRRHDPGRDWPAALHVADAGLPATGTRPVLSPPASARPVVPDRNDEQPRAMTLGVNAVPRPPVQTAPGADRPIYDGRCWSRTTATRSSEPKKTWSRTSRITRTLSLDRTIGRQSATSSGRTWVGLALRRLLRAGQLWMDGPRSRPLLEAGQPGGRSSRSSRRNEGTTWR